MLYYIGKTKMRHVLKFKHCREKYLVYIPPHISLVTAIVTKTGFFRLHQRDHNIIEKFQDIFIFFRPSLYSQWW